MTAQGRFLLLACCVAACLGLALAALPVRHPSDCVNSNLLRAAGNVYPPTHRIQAPTLQDSTTVQVAQNFEITYGSTYKVLTNINGADNETYVLYQCGTAAPKLAELNLPANTKMFSVPLTAVSAADTTVVNIMKLLGVQDRVSYVTSYTVDPCMQLLATTQCNRSSGSTDKDSVDAVFDFEKKANETKSVMFAATADQGPLHGAEYIKYIAAFFNREAVANTIFTQIYNAYNQIYNAVQAVRASSSDTPPVLAWVYYQMSYGPKYPEQIQIKFHGFRTQYTKDAGAVLPDLESLKAKYVDGVNVKVDYKGDLMLLNLDSVNTTATLRDILANVDFVIDESYVSGNVSKYTLDSFLALYRLNYSTATTDLKFLKNGNLLRLDGTASTKGTTAWYEEALARPDVALHDLVSFITPVALKSIGDTRAPRLVRNLFPNLHAGIDGRVNGALVLTADQCSLFGSGKCSAAAQPICPALYLDCAGKLVTATAAQPCAPTCPVGLGGAAGRAMVTPAVLIALIVAALAAVMSPICAWL